MRKLLLVLGVLFLAGIMAGAFAIDSVRLTMKMRDEVNAADEAMKVAETRLVRTLSGWPEAPAPIKAALQTYAEKNKPEERREAYDSLVAATQQVIQSSDPAQHPPQTLKDDIAGAINRRAVAERPFREVESEYQSWLKTFRGRIGEEIIEGSSKDSEQRSD